jgi:streptogramin lyase
MKFTPRLVCTLLAVLTCTEVMAGTLSGTVTDPQGKGLEGVLVRATSALSGISESVYSNKTGKFSLQTNLSGELALRLRTPYFSDVEGAIALGATEHKQKDFVMEPMTDPMEISDSLPAAYHFGSLPFDKEGSGDFTRTLFQRDCLSCHQVGNSFTRVPRSAESWSQSIERMHKYLGNFDMELRDSRSEILSKGFNGEPVSVRPTFPLDQSLAVTKIYEYPLSNAQVPHDAIYNPDDGLIYTIDQRLDQIDITDPVTGITEVIKQPEVPPVEPGTAERPQVVSEYVSGSHNGPHSLAMGLDGKYYVTNSGSRSIGVFDPKSKKWEASHIIPADTNAIYPHTIRTDKDGMLWFTLTGSEQVGRLNPKTGEFTILALPTHKPQGIAGTTQPYGIDVNPIDGSIWYTRLFADKIGHIDPASLKIVEYDSPVKGPRRMRFDKQGILWVTGYSEGVLGRIDVADEFSSRVYPMPEFAPGFRPAPYALGVHPQTQEIWINENMTDRIYRFIPSEQRFVAYPVPLRGTYTRDMTFTTAGHICMSNNPIPTPALEGGVLEIICIDNNYRPDRRPAKG